MKKKIIISMVTVSLLLCLLICVAVATSLSGSGQYKNKGYDITQTGSYSKMQSYASTSNCFTKTTYTGSLTRYVYAKVAEIRYATNTTTNSKTGSNTVTTNGYATTGTMSRAAGDSNLKYVHTGYMKVNSSVTVTVDDYSYTAWQNY